MEKKERVYAVTGARRKKVVIYAVTGASGRWYAIYPDVGNTWLLYHDFPTTEITGIPSLKEAKDKAKEVEKAFLSGKSN